jgi:Spy/CpxP family protein refolding chaperone
LTEDQRKLAQSIRQKYFAATKTHREQLFQLREKRLAGTFTAEDQERAKTLRQEMMTAMRGMREESLGVLTPEQRSQLDSLRGERRQRREEMRQRRQELRQNRPPLN